MLTSKSTKPETAQFIWRHGTDPAGGFNTGDPGVKWSNDPKSTKKPHGEPTIVFGSPDLATWVELGESTGDLAGAPTTFWDSSASGVPCYFYRVGQK